MNKKQPLKKCKTYLSYSSISNDARRGLEDLSFLDILDSVEEHNIDNIDNIHNIHNIDKKSNNKCKCCNKVILNHKLESHQVSCFQNRISELEHKIEELKSQINITRETTRDLVSHEIRIRGIELLIERNNQKWNKIMKNGIK